MGGGNASFAGNPSRFLGWKDSVFTGRLFPNPREVGEVGGHHAAEDQRALEVTKAASAQADADAAAHEAVNAASPREAATLPTADHAIKAERIELEAAKVADTQTHNLGHNNSLSTKLCMPFLGCVNISASATPPGQQAGSDSPQKPVGSLSSLDSDRAPDPAINERYDGAVRNAHVRAPTKAPVARGPKWSPPKQQKKLEPTSPVSPEFIADAAILKRRDAYRKKLERGSYSFNPPSPIKVATPVTVFFLLDPLVDPMHLGVELKAKLLEMHPHETPKTEEGRMDWSPKMRAKLVGDDFDITPIEGQNSDGLKYVSSTKRTQWAWDVKAKDVGEALPLHLQVWAVLSDELGKEDEILKLDKTIQVDVTWFWLVNQYWEKYWKWILGGLGTALSGAIGMWWKNRQPKATEA